jgi:glycosyltransferase involved in cell wall biosynthesis
MRLTVAICTWNRCKLLQQALEQMTKLAIPQGVEWELLVINNNCTDATDEVIASYADRLPILRLFEPRQGHSNARNLAARHATGELSLWTDDDVIVDHDWLAEYVLAARRWPKAVYFGGMITPCFEKEPPQWITENLKQLEGMLVIRNFGSVERPFKGTEQPWGANMAFRQFVFKDYLFNPRIGRQADTLILGDETELFERLRKSSQQGVWVPTSRVRHYVPAERLTRKYLWSFFQGIGRTDVRMRGVPEGKLLWGVPRWLFRTSWEMKWRYYWRRLSRQADWIQAYIQAAQIGGVIQEVRALRSEIVLRYKDS